MRLQVFKFSHRHPCRGFALPQLVIVLFVGALLAAVFFSRTGGGGPEHNAQVADLKTHLRYAQARAMEAQGPEDPRFWGIRRNGGSYQMVVIEADGEQTHRILPGEEDITVVAERLNFVDSFQAVYFDRQGRPYVGDPPARPGTHVDVTVGYRAVKVIRNTGIIP
ncbi:pilus assembly FimT family protein [Desulfurivibrio dismutans]|uniref:pilus assembly FimT family protein n=1 Tax=Desulfurivibrio dismutans TaxID=1398908 RepID=UPI0023DB55A8|nr:hypothetical protein [Desulfurivibrio alkaliphilus]MDF1613340.1 hypothetical protein [Desulfurivibrio alkaliphilus]